ncbi:ATP-binding cassette domain-containing protein, partial [Escherichia coli]
MSGGERRRAVIARGLAQGADLILLDEPTNHLDVRHQLQLLETLRASGRTVVA